MITVDEFWAMCNDTCKELMRKGHTPAALFTQNCAIVYTAMKCMQNGRRGNESIDDDGNRGVCLAELGESDGDGGGRVRNEHGEGVQEEARDQQDEKGGQGQKGGEEGKAEEQAMSDLCRMRKIERGRVLYCLDYIIRSLNDEDAQYRWLSDGVPDGMIDDKNILTEEQVEGHAEFVDSQQQLDEYVALAAKILFSEAFPKAWARLTILDPHTKRDLFEPERCVLT